MTVIPQVTVTEDQIGQTIDSVDLIAFAFLDKALREAPKGRIEVSPMLSLDRPESIQNFKALEALLREVFMAGAAVGFSAKTAQPALPAGWKPLPPELTDTMMRAWIGPQGRLLPARCGSEEESNNRYRQHYRDLFAVAPEPYGDSDEPVTTPTTSDTATA